MEGGLNKWVETIMRPVKPGNEASDEEFAQYAFRKAASMYFGKAGTVNNASENDAPQTLVPPIKKEKKGNTGGC